MRSGFTWICSISVAAGVWFLLPPLQDNFAIALLEAVICQETGRYAYYRFCAVAERRVAVGSANLIDVFYFGQIQYSIHEDYSEL